MSVYNAAIPQSTDLISNSQPQILANFSQLNTQYLADHDGFNTGSGNGSGMHDQVTFLANQSAPSLTRNSVAGVSGLYVNTDGTNSQLFFQNAAGSFRMTGGDIAATAGYTYLPGGLIMQWVKRSANGAFTWPLTFPNACFGATMGYNNAVSTFSPNLTPISASGATLNNSGGAIVFIMALGN